MKRINYLKISLILLLVITILTDGYYNGMIFASKKQPKLLKPKLIPVGTSFVQSKKKTYAKSNTITIYEKISSSKKGSKIYYSLNGKNPKKKGILYKKSIPINVNHDKSKVLKAVNTKKGHLDSNIVKREYRRVMVAPMIPIDGIETEKIIKGVETIKGTITMNITEKERLSKNLYIVLKVKGTNGECVEYTTKVYDGKWSIKLNSVIKEGDEIFIDANTKDCIVCFTKIEDSPKNVIGVYTYYPNWVNIRKKIE